MLIRSFSPLTCHITGSFKSALQVKFFVFAVVCCLLKGVSGATSVVMCAVHVIPLFERYFQFLDMKARIVLCVIIRFVLYAERPGSDLLRHEHFPPQQTGIGRCYGFFHSL